MTKVFGVCADKTVNNVISTYFNMKKEMLAFSFHS